VDNNARAMGCAEQEDWRWEMNINEINEAFDREYEKYKSSPEYKEGFVKLKMPTYYIAKHSDEDLQAAILAERMACAKICEEFGRNLGGYKAHEDNHDDGWQDACCEIETAIRARGEK
jgi:hypothetical protein